MLVALASGRTLGSVFERAYRKEAGHRMLPVARIAGATSFGSGGSRLGALLHSGAGRAVIGAFWGSSVSCGAAMLLYLIHVFFYAPIGTFSTWQVVLLGCIGVAVPAAFVGATQIVWFVPAFLTRKAGGAEIIMRGVCSGFLALPVSVAVFYLIWA
jgi:hypothetical protein